MTAWNYQTVAFRYRIAVVDSIGQIIVTTLSLNVTLNVVGLYY